MQALYSILQDGLKGTSELLALIEDYVRAASWQELVQPLLPQLPEEALLRCCTHALPVNTFGEETCPSINRLLAAGTHWRLICCVETAEVPNTMLQHSLHKRKCEERSQAVCHTGMHQAIMKRFYQEGCIV